MANKTFDALTALSAPATGDLVAIADIDASNEAKKTTVGELAAVVSTELSLGTAATTASTDYATAAQGATADSAVQPADVATLVDSGALTITGQADVSAGSVTDVIAVTQSQYDNRDTSNDATTLFVISDGQSDAEAINDILQLSTDFADFKSRMNTAYGS